MSSQLLPSGRVAAMAPYNIHVINACKAHPDRQWDNQLKAWTVPGDKLGELAASLRGLQKAEVTLLPLPKLAQRAVEAK